MKKILLFIWLFISLIFSFHNISFAVDEDVKNVLWEVSENRAGEIWVSKESSYGLRDFMINIGHDIMIPIFVVLWLLVAFIWFYKLFFTDKEDDRKKGLNYFIWWVTWIVIMVSAWFLTNLLVWETWNIGIIWSNTSFDPATIANRLYGDIIHKFFILVMYLVVGILMIMILISAIRFMSTPDSDEVQKKSRTIIIWNAIWIIAIIFSKNIIEMFYKQTKSGTSNLNAGWAILENKNIWWLYTVLNYFLGFIAFTITIFIIYQAFLLLTKPDDDNTYKNLKKYFVYSIIWIALIGWVYLIVNFFVVK